MTIKDVKSTLVLEIYEYPCSRGEVTKAHVQDDAEKLQDISFNTHYSTMRFSLESNVESMTFKNAEGGTVDISPLSMKIDMNKGLGLTLEEASDPWDCYYISINYKDGTNYIVHEHALNGKHTCDVEIDNTSYGCETENNMYIQIFNRLVDISNIASITVNETPYTVE